MNEPESSQPISEIIVPYDQVLTFFSWAVGVLFVAATVFIIWILNRTFQCLCVQSTPSEIYDQNAVVRCFLELLGEARESMIVYDNDSGEESVYNDERVMAAVQSKLRNDSGFALRCLFDAEDDLAFRKAFADHQRVDIRIRRGPFSASEVHYRIIDGGAKACLSRYVLGSGERRFRVVDCTPVRKRHRDRVANIILGRYKEHFERAFEASDRSA